MNDTDNVASLSDELFYVWLAGFFDGEGCVHLPKRGVDISIANTDRGIIRLIARRTGVGIINEISYSRPEWKTKYHWRVRNYPHAAKFLSRVIPYLSLKHDSAIAAMDRALQWEKELCELEARAIEMQSLCDQGLTQKEVGLRFGVTGGAVRNDLRGLNGRRTAKSAPGSVKRYRESECSKSSGMQVSTKVRRTWREPA
jgi:hypothetical protein